MGFSIAIDGPAAAGKSTAARRIAHELDYIYIDTGAMYRAMGLYLLRKGIMPTNVEVISTQCTDADISIIYENNEQIVCLNGENVNGLIRTEEIGNVASAIGIVPAVRKKLVALQRKLAENANVVMDGRDIGTCVLPNADIKIYLTANSEVRAKRRYLQLMKKGEQCDLEMVAKELRERDHQDMTREISPLRQAEDAIMINTSDMDIEQMVGTILSLL